MSQNKLTLFVSKKETPFTWCMPANEALNNFDAKMKGKLLPVLSFDMGQIKSEYAGIPAHIIHHDSGMHWLKFRIEDGKYSLVDQSDKLEKIEDAGEIDKKKKFLTAEPEMTSEFYESFQYDGSGLLAKHLLRSGNYEVYEWEESEHGSRPKMKTFFLGEFNLAATRTQYSYDADGFYAGKKVTNLARSLELKEELEYTTEKNGDVRITKTGDTNRSIKLRRKGSDATLEYLIPGAPRQTRTVGGNPGWPELIDYIHNFFRKTIVAVPDKNEKLEITRGLADDGRLISLAYNYSSKETAELISTISIEPNPDDSFWVKELAGAPKKKPGCTYSFCVVPRASGWKIEPFYEGSHSGNDYNMQLPGVSRQQAVLRCIDERNILFAPAGPAPDWKQDRYGNTWHTTHETNANGAVEKTIVSHVELRSEKRAALDCTKPIPWKQQDATPVDSTGAKMEYLCCMDSPQLFGRYYLFFSKAEKTVTQVFQAP